MFTEWFKGGLLRPQQQYNRVASFHVFGWSFLFYSPYDAGPETFPCEEDADGWLGIGVTLNADVIRSHSDLKKMIIL